MVARDVDDGIWRRVEAILGAGFGLALATTGGGTEAVSWLLNHPGASAAVVEAQVPYHATALADYLGSPGPHRVQESTAVHLAGTAFTRVVELAGEDQPAVGLGCTAALATSRTRRGEDRAHVAVRAPGAYRCGALRFGDEIRGRSAQEDALSRLVVAMLLETCAGTNDPDAWPRGLDLQVRELSLDDPLNLLLRGDLEVVEVLPDGRAVAEVGRRGRVLLPGSFNPLHQGHLSLATLLSERCGAPTCAEISVTNVDKEPLTRADLERRLAQFQGRLGVIVTRAATFDEKVRLFGRCTFGIGFDTAVRLLDPRYYGDDVAGMNASLEHMRAAATRFIVAGRLHQGAFRTLADLPLPATQAGMFAALAESQFRCDVSSTQIRSAAAGDPA